MLDVAGMITVVAKYDSKYETSVERVTITIERAVLAKIRRVAGPRGVSRFINASTKEKLARLDILAVLDDLDAKHGHATKAERAAVDRDMRRIFRR